MRMARGVRATLFTLPQHTRHEPESHEAGTQDPAAPLTGDTANGIAPVGLFCLAMGSLRWPVAQPERRQSVHGNWGPAHQKLQHISGARTA